jgi:hypothetical protein
MSLSLADRQARPFGGVESGLPAASEFSPDGRWIAYQTGEPHPPDPLANATVFVQPFPATGVQYQIPGGGVRFRPIWSPDRNRRELFFAIGTLGPRVQWVAAPIATTQPLTVGTPRPLPSGELTGSSLPGQALNLRNYAVAPDGRWIGLVRVSPASETSPVPADVIQVVLNWSEELKKRVPIK